MSKEIKVVVFDATFAVNNYRGMGKYIRQVIEMLMNIEKMKVIGLLPNNTINTQEKNNIQFLEFGTSFYPIWEQLCLPRKLKKLNADYFIAPYNTAPLITNDKTKLVLIVHDLIFLNSFKDLPLSPDFRQKIGRLYRRWNVPKAINKADVIITVSEFSAHEIKKYANPQTPVYVIPNCINCQDFSEKQPRSFINLKPYIFHLGGDAPHKNTGLLIASFIEICNSNIVDLDLHIVGVKDKNNLLRLHNMSPAILNKIYFHDFLNEHQVKSLYQNALFFVFSSIHEGFGIPIIEAMAAGTPVLLSNASVLPEIGGDAALYFNPYSVSDLTNKIISLASSADLRESLIKKGKKRVKTHYDISRMSSLLTNFVKRELK